MKKIKIALFDAKPYDIDFFNEANRKYGFSIKYFADILTCDNVLIARGFDAVCCFVNDKIDTKVIKLLKKDGVKLIALRSAGYNNVDLKAAHGRLHVVRVPAYSPAAVAEHAVALMLALNRKTHKAYLRTRENNFSILGLIGFDMEGKTAGIIGTGKIGKALVRILAGFGMKVIAYDPDPDEQFAADTGMSYCSLDEIYKKSDVISLNCPLTSNTYHMIDKKSISRMKSSVMIINTGRGKLIDTKALIEALKGKRIGSAGLDVYEEESEYFFKDYSASFVDDDTLARLLTFGNVLITSHQGFFTKEALSNIASTTLENVKFFFFKGDLPNEICYKCGRKVCLKKTKGKCF
ncbi:MAG: 2-hydroxyacid dehydrogenase [Candidatus Margulisiibacteriota bacterium]